MTVRTRSQVHSHTRSGTPSGTRCSVLGNDQLDDPDHTHAHSNRRKATPKKTLSSTMTGDDDATIKRRLFGDDEPTPAKNESNSKVIKNVAWRSLYGSLKLTDNNIIFQTRNSECKDKRLAWDNIATHEVRVMTNPVVDRSTPNPRHLLKIQMKKEGSQSIVLRFANQKDLDNMDQEVTRRLRARSIATFTKIYGMIATKPRPHMLQQPKTTYYPIVKLCGSIPGSLTLKSDEFIFKPLSPLPNLPIMAVRWYRVNQSQVRTQFGQTSLKITCKKTSKRQPPIVFQLASPTELQRLQKDITHCLDWTKVNAKWSSSDSPLVRRGASETPIRSNQSNKPAKHVTFAASVIGGAISSVDMYDSIPDLTETSSTSSSFDEMSTDEVVVSPTYSWAKKMAFTTCTLVFMVATVWLVAETMTFFLGKDVIARWQNEASFTHEMMTKDQSAQTNAAAPAPIPFVETNDLVFQSLKALFARNKPFPLHDAIPFMMRYN